MKCLHSKIVTVLFLVSLLSSLTPAAAQSTASRSQILQTTSPAAVVAVAPTVEKLREVSDAIRGRITALPHRRCTLSVQWWRYTTLMEDILSRLTESSDAGERGRALFVLGELDKYVTMAESLSAETCADYDAVAAAEHTGQRHLEQARQRLRRVAAAIKGTDFPFDRFGDFRRFYNDVNWNDHASPPEYWMTRFTTPLEDIYRLVLRYTTVSNGQVRVQLPGGRQTVPMRFTKGAWVPIFGDSLERNWLYFSVYELSGGARLQTARFSKNCARKNSAYHCFGSVLRKLESAQGRYRLSTMVSRQMQSALQAHVTAACKRKIGDQEAMRDIVLEHRPDDKQVRRAYEGAAERFLAKIARVASSGKGMLCSVGSKVFIEGLLDVAVDAWNRELGPGRVPREVYERFRGRLQRELDIAGKLILDEFSPPFGTVSAAAVPSAGLFGTLVHLPEGIIGGAGGPADALARAQDSSFSLGVRARAAAQAARGFAAAGVAAGAIAARRSAFEAALNAEGYARAAVAAEAAGRDRESAAALQRAIRAARKAQVVAEGDD